MDKRNWTRVNWTTALTISLLPRVQCWENIYKHNSINNKFYISGCARCIELRLNFHWLVDSLTQSVSQTKTTQCKTFPIDNGIYPLLILFISKWGFINSHTKHNFDHSITVAFGTSANEATFFKIYIYIWLYYFTMQFLKKIKTSFKTEQIKNPENIAKIKMILIIQYDI